MDVCVAIDHRFQKTPDGTVWTQTTFSYPFWQRYLEVFDRVRVVARVREVEEASSSWTPASGTRVLFAAVPYYHGPAQYLRHMGDVQRVVGQSLGREDAVILRVQGQVASCARPYLRRTRHPYAVEVVGDPYDAFAPGYVSHPLRPFLRWWFPRRMKEQCAGACAAAYVTEYALQRRYPPSPGAYSTHYSSIVLPREALATAPRTPRMDSQPLVLVFVGTLDNLSKGPDTLIKALPIVVRVGLDIRVRIVGGGKYQAELAALAGELDVADRLEYAGWVASGHGVREQLDSSDLFVLPSRQEGLSRATIEAMARGLPCITTSIGGMAELLPPEDMVLPNDVDGLAAKIIEVASSPDRMAAMAARNLSKAGDYEESLLRQRRIVFYREIRERTAGWLAGRTEGVCQPSRP